MLLIGYCLGIRSERRLCEEVHLNLAYRWFCRFGLDGAVPDHSTFSKNRHGRFRDSDLLRDLFEMTVTGCIEEGLVGDERFAVDASLIKADANRQRGVPGEDGLPPDIVNHAAREYLEVLDAAAFGAASPVTPKYLSPADLPARWTSAHGGQAFFAYSANYLIDLANAVIVDVEATTAIRPAEVTAQRPEHVIAFAQNGATKASVGRTHVAGAGRARRQPPRNVRCFAKTAHSFWCFESLMLNLADLTIRQGEPTIPLFCNDPSQSLYWIGRVKTGIG